MRNVRLDALKYNIQTDIKVTYRKNVMTDAAGFFTGQKWNLVNK
jgi:hypothetical protein